MSTQKEIFETSMHALADSVKAKTNTTDTTITGMKSAIDGIIISSGVSLNVEYGDTAPSDTSKLWIKCADPSKVVFTPNFSGASDGATMNTMSETLPQALINSCCCNVGTNCYIFGGYDSSYLNTIYKYDKLTDTCTAMNATLPQALQSACCCSVGTDCYIFGGFFYNSSLKKNIYSTAIYKYDTLTNTCTNANATLPQGLSSACCCNVGTDCYVFGGYNGTRLDTIYKYDTLTNTCTNANATLPQGLSSACCCNVGTDCFIFGGYSVNNTRVNTIYKYDTLTNTCTAMNATLPQVLSSACCCNVGTDCFIFGGCNGPILLNTIYKYDKLTDTCTAMNATLPQALQNACCCNVGTDCFIFGGSNSIVNGGVNTIYDFSVSISLTNGELELVENGNSKSLSFIVSDTLDLNVGISQAYKGNTSNHAEMVHIYEHNGTSWELVV